MAVPPALLLLVALLVPLLVAFPLVAVAEPTDPIGGERLGATGITVWSGAPGAVPPPEPLAQAWLVADIGTGTVLATRNPHQKLRPASTLKTLTALALLPRLDPAATYTPVDEDALQDGSLVGLVPGTTYTIKSLFEGMLLSSGNDAAHALANAAGGLQQTVALMNATAKELQAYDTVAANPSGLDDDVQLTSAYDLALIARGVSPAMTSAAMSRRSTPTSPASTVRTVSRSRITTSCSPIIRAPSVSRPGTHRSACTRSSVRPPRRTHWSRCCSAASRQGGLMQQRCSTGASPRVRRLCRWAPWSRHEPPRARRPPRHRLLRSGGDGAEPRR